MLILNWIELNVINFLLIISSDVFRYEWYDRASRFSRSYRDVAMAVDKLVNIPNRELLYDIYAYITDMRSTLALVNSYIKWLGTSQSLVADLYSTTCCS